MLYRHGLGALFAVVLGLLSHNAARADQIFVTNAAIGMIGAYTTAGATVDPALISGLSRPFGIAVSGSDLVVASGGSGTTGGGRIGKYTTAGGRVNAPMISVMSLPSGVAASDAD